MQKNTFFEGTKKTFSVQKILWDFLYMYKGGLCKKNNTGSKCSSVGSVNFHFKTCRRHIETWKYAWYILILKNAQFLLYIFFRLEYAVIFGLCRLELHRPNKIFGTLLDLYGLNSSVMLHLTNLNNQIVQIFNMWVS